MNISGRTFFITMLLLMATGCSTINKSDLRESVSKSKEVQAVSQAGGDWGFIEFAEIRAYRVNWHDPSPFHGDELVAEGELNPTRIPLNGIPLNKYQAERLRLAVTGEHRNHGRSMCFRPRHAFAFYNEEGSIIGCLDICFSCSTYRGWPEGFARSWNLRKLRKLFRDLDIPISDLWWHR